MDLRSLLRSLRARRSSGVSSLCLDFDLDLDLPFFDFFAAFSSLRLATRYSYMGSSGSIGGPSSSEDPESSSSSKFHGVSRSR